MLFFEFHFNPKLKSDLIFDSFCYEPENIYEQKKGNLYLIGLLRNVLSQNLHFLDKLAKIIKDQYYRSILATPEKSLRESLKQANEFLEGIAKKGDVSWLGNLNFAVLSLKDYQLNFTKVGDLKIFLLRGKKIIDIDRKLKFEEITPWPLRIFGNVVSGKLSENDLLLVLTKEVADFFEKENLLSEIEKIWPIEEKKLQELFEKRKEEVLKISGIALIIVLTKEIKKGKKQVISEKLYPREFKLKEIFSPYFKKLAKNFIFFINIFKELIKKPKLKKPSLGRLSTLAIFSPPKIIFSKLNKINKRIILILALVFFLFLGSFFSQLQEEREIKKHEATLKKIQEKVEQAESFLILKTTQTEKKANLLLKESWEEISHLDKISPFFSKDFQAEVFSLKERVSKTLFELNKVEIIEEPKLFFEFDVKNFIPQKMIFFNDSLYFFNPYSENLFKLNKNAQAEIIEIDQKFNLATPSKEKILFLAKPNKLWILKENQFIPFTLKEPYSDFSFDSFNIFREHLYFLDKKSGEIIRYPYLGNLKWGAPQLWLDRKEKKEQKWQGLTVNGSVWLLEKDKESNQWLLNQYYRGQLKEKIILEIFPQPEEITKVFSPATLPYFYLLDPLQKRIIILDKKGGIIKQFQSQKFNNLIDFVLSEDSKTIWLLNGLKVYQITQ